MIALDTLIKGMNPRASSGLKRKLDSLALLTPQQSCEEKWFQKPTISHIIGSDIEGHLEVHFTSILPPSGQMV
jgi:hypothetical protein